MNMPEFLTQDAYGYIRITGHRIGLHHLVRLYKEGYSPALLADEFPTLPLALIHQVIAFYLENQAEVEAYVARERAEFERQAASSHHGPGLAELRRRKEVEQQVELS